MLALHTPTARALFARPNLLRRAVPTSKLTSVRTMVSGSALVDTDKSGASVAPVVVPVVRVKSSSSNPMCHLPQVPSSVRSPSSGTRSRQAHALSQKVAALRNFFVSAQNRVLSPDVKGVVNLAEQLTRQMLPRVAQPAELPAVSFALR
jgi:hypothetical protein